ncbi:MAG TPA: hypothetical protein VEB60_00585 [Candidatus Paceibacterota bacterium]|nr:hypothetical protein [Candidatus Paceibacterota bacterium]
MLIIILLSTSLASLTALVGMIVWQMVALRQGRAGYGHGPSLSAVIQPKIDHAAFHFSTFASALLKRLSLLVLSGIRSLLVLVKQLLGRLEKRFGRTINAMKGKGPVSKKGSVSLFRQEVEQYRLEVRSAKEDSVSRT